MADLDHILERLRRQRDQLDEAIGDSTLNTRYEEILRKLDELRQRSQATAALTGAPPMTDE